MNQTYDAIIIGSGFGGAVTGLRLAEAGMKILVLERGRRWQADTYPSVTNEHWIWDQNAPEKHHGWLDLRVFGDMSVAMGAGVGGGSLIYANIFIKAKPQTFESGWPAEITYNELLPHYERTGKMLNVHRLPENQLTERYKIMREGAEQLGRADRFTPLELAVNFDKDWHYGLDDPFNYERSKRFRNDLGLEQGTCVHCGNCDIGCPVYAKNTLDLNYIPQAEKHGAEVRSLHRAINVAPEGKGYRVHFHRYEQGQAIVGSETATRVVLAAGSIGSTELLLNCRDTYASLPRLSPRLGHGWCANGDFLTPSYHPDRRISPTRGPTITCAIDLLDGVEEGSQCFIEDGGLPDVMGNYFAELSKKPVWARFTRRWFLPDSLDRLARTSDPLHNMMVWFGQAVDQPGGQMYLGRPWYAPWKKTLKMRWDYASSEPVMNTMASLHKRLALATGGTPFTPATWTWFKNLITPHPLGGCNMGNSVEDGVVNHAGEVFNYPRLYVADGAIIPRALGLNPSRTIASLAERNAALLLGKDQ